MSKAIKQNQLEKIRVYNIWDAGSAQVVAKSGARAIATSSWAIAKAYGFNDGEQIPYELVSCPV